ncbi:uncharacterized protein LOC125656545 [Ostrea edulis]|uniref:uncharacterized protein LOC125656545 n=1 Tax=Ostrea edulis TaxID=37623 RepID=UPI0024AFB7D9|nr:uncharacterized protein LOC125656545 [Ostrea edulis]
MSGIVESCPTNLTEVLAASARLNCSKDGHGNDQYACLPNSKKTGLVEFYHEGGIPLVVDGYCLETEGGQFYYSKCQHFINGCPSKPYLANDIYKYPACLNINTENQCFLADPSCPNLTSPFTTKDLMDTASTYSGFSNTTVNTLYNTTTSIEDAPDVGAVVGGVLAGICVIAGLLILVCLVLRRKKQRKHHTNKRNDEESQPLTEPRNRYEESSNPPAGNDDEIQPLTSIDKQRDGYEENSNPTAESKKPEDKEDSVPDEESQKPDDKKYSVPDEVKNQIENQGIDFLRSMSSEHEKYRNGIAQILQVPVEVLGMSNEDIETFIRNYKKGSTKVYCGRGMVVGYFGAGKTTLVKKLKGEDASHPPESTRGLEVHTNIFTLDEDETSLMVNKDQTSKHILQITLGTSGSESDETSLNATQSNPKADDEIQSTTISSAINGTEPSSQKHEKKYDGSESDETSLNATQSNPKADDEIQSTTISSAINGTEPSSQKHEKKYDGSESDETSLNATQSNPKADDEIQSTTISSAINGTEPSSKKHEKKYDFPFQKIKTGFTLEKSNDFPSKAEEKSHKTGKYLDTHLVKDQIKHSVPNKTDENQQILGHDIGIILPNVSDKPVKTISLLDFAGQDAYYACHHIFLSPRSFYILVTDMSKELTEKPANALQTKDLVYSDWTHQDYINHWLGSIHTYSSETAPVILVLSHSETKVKAEKKYFQKVLEGVPKTLQGHLSVKNVFAVEKDSDKNIEKIKLSMMKVVTEQSHWGESIPTSWVHLEAYLMEIKKRQMVLQKKNLWKALSSKKTMGITSEEDMTTALKLFNDIGVIVFTTSTESIILDVQWFVNAFKHIITDEGHAEYDIAKHFHEWTIFNTNGILPKNLVKEIWRGQESFTKYTEDLIFHMTNLGMIAEMEKGEKYYVPCMNKQKYYKSVLQNCTCSSTVCFMFEYLPLVIFHRLIATCMTKEGWRIWNGNDENHQKFGQTSECVFHTAAILKEKNHLKILIGITEKKKSLQDPKNTHPYSIEIQGIVFKDEKMPRLFSEFERIKQHLKDLTSCFGANRDRAYKIGFRCSRVPFADTFDSHIILQSANECTECRKSGVIDNMKIDWTDDGTSRNDTFDIIEKHHERNMDQVDLSPGSIEHDKNVTMASSHSASTPETTNLLRAFLLLLGPCTKQFRDVLRRYIPHSTFSQVISQEENKNALLRLTTVQRDLIVPTHGSYSGTYDDMDIPLIYMLLRNVCSIPPHSKGWGKDPDSIDRSLSANIERIRIARNKCAHYPSDSLSNSEFNSLWSEVRSAVVDLDSSLNNGNQYEREVDLQRQKSMNLEREHRLREEIRKQAEQIRENREEIQRVNDKVDMIEDKLQEHTRKTEEIQQNQMKVEGNGEYIQPDHKQDHDNVLHEACKNAELQTCEHLIQTYPDLLHSVDNDGWNAALYAARGGNVKILQLLADNEVDVKHKANNGWNILHAACRNGELEMSRYIIQTYPHLLHSVDNDGWNAALYAARGGNVKILQLLADNEVDVKHKANNGWNILHAACRNGELEMSRYIIQTYPDLLHSVDNAGWNAALHASGGGNVKILQLLADNEVDVKHKDNDGWNILYAACRNGELEMSRYIIQTYPDLLHSVHNDGWNAALHASGGGNVKILQLLADNEVDVKHKDNDGWNILYVACGNANLEMSRYIIQTYPDLLHSVDNDGWNAALFAAERGNVNILQLLADNEVDVKHKANNGWNILHAACRNGELEMSRYIIQTYPALLHSVDNDGWNAALFAAGGGNVNILQLLADNEVDVKHQANNGWNILHAACGNANLEMSRYIIQTYPDLLHSVDNDGWNAAFYAARRGHVKIRQLLTEHGVKT